MAADHIGTTRLDRVGRGSAAALGAVLAAACLVAAAGPARAGSAAQLTQSLGLPVGAQIPHGLYWVTTTNFGVRATAPGVTPLNVNATTLAWATPWDIAGGRLQLFLAGSYSAVGLQDRDWQSGLGQPLVAAQLAWDLGGDVGFSYLLGGYFPGRTGIVTQAPSLTHRFALSYVGNDWNLTGHLFYGHFLGDRPPPGWRPIPTT